MKAKTLLLVAILVLPLLSLSAPSATVAAPTISVFPGTGIAGTGITNAFFVSGGGYDGGVQLWAFVGDWSNAYDNVYLGSPEDYVQGQDVIAKTRFNGAVPDYAYLIVDGYDLLGKNTTLIGVAQTDTNPDREDRAYRNVKIINAADAPYLTITDVSEFDSVEVGDTFTVTGEGFTPNGDVKIYWNNPDNLIATTTADEDGKIEVDVTVPESPSGYMALLVYDVKADVLALNEENGDHNWFALVVVSSVELDGTSIRGEEEERFNLIGHGFAYLNLVTEPTDTAYLAGEVDEDVVTVYGVETYHDGATANTNGYIRISNIELGDDVDTTGWVDVTVDWYTDVYSDTATGNILVSRPAECAGASFDTAGTTEEYGNVGDSFTIYVWNFDANANVQVAFGGVLFETTIHTDRNGAGSASFEVPEQPGGDYVIRVFCNGEYNVSLLYTIEPELSIDVSGDYVKSGTVITVKATGLDPDDVYEITEDNELILPNTGYYEITTGSVESESDSLVKPNQLGTFEMKYEAFYDPDLVSTEDEIVVEMDGLTDSYLAVATADLVIDTLDPDVSHVNSFVGIEAGEKPTLKISDPYLTLVPTWEYQVLVDGRAIKVRPVGERTFTGDDIQTEPISFRWNVTATGMHTIEVVEKDTGESIWSIDVLVSDVDGPEHMYVTPTTATSDVDVTVYLWNFDSSEDVTIYFGCNILQYLETVDEFGALKTTIGGLDFYDVPMGDYRVKAVGDISGAAEETFTVSILPTFEPSEIEDSFVYDIFSIDWYNLEPNTRYELLINGIDVDTQTSDDYGYVSFVNVEVPELVPGTYNITLRKVLDGSIVPTYEDEIPTIEVTNVLNLPLEAIPGQMVEFEWELPSVGYDAAYVTVNINGQDYAHVMARVEPSDIPGYDVIKGSFIMPNGEAGELLTVKLYAFDDGLGLLEESNATCMYRAQGAGALLLGADLASDIAYIKGTVSTISVSLSELNATVVGMKDDLVEIKTTLGTMYSTLEALNASVTSISEDVAALSTDLGDVKVAVNDLASAISSAKDEVITAVNAVKSDVAALSSDITSIKDSVSGVASAVSGLESDISSVKSDIAALKSSVSSVSSDVSAVKSTVEAIKSDTTGLGNISTFVIIAAILAAIAVVLEIVVLARQKR